MTTHKKGRNGGNRATQNTAFEAGHDTGTEPPMVTGQCAEVLQVIRERHSVPSFELTANLAIPEAAARIHELRSKGYNVLTVILPEFEFRGVIRRNVARYSMGTPEWPAPGFLDDQGGGE